MAKLVIVVDNVAAVRDTLCDAFRAIYEEQVRSGELLVEGVPDGASLIARSAVQAPDLVLMDVDMPEVDGIDAFYRFKQQHPDATRAVFFLTGLAGAPSTNRRLEQAVMDGAGGFMSKPTSAASLQAVAERILFSR